MSETPPTKYALVTGASRGIGKAIALRLAQDGFDLICVSRSLESGAGVVSEINALGGKARALAVDVADGDAVAAACEALLGELGGIEVLVNNAGITRDGLFIRMSDSDWRTVIETNLNSCFYWTHGLVRPMTRNRSGRIINISSVVGISGNAGQANYAAAKAGMIGFSKSLARELASRNITVNVVAPGFIETDMTDVLPDTVKDEAKKAIPLKRFGRSEEIASMVSYLAGDAASYITGKVFTVDGGMVI
ncbi:MAG: 3-oxoacyl-[acyl-carrier-protein] reductase [Puniceicoccaceae bacterium]